MRDYAELIERLRYCADRPICFSTQCDYRQTAHIGACFDSLKHDAADAIEELLGVCEKMHTWIFLHTTDEQAAYDEIGLTDEQNAMFGYSGQMILKAEPPKEDKL